MSRPANVVVAVDGRGLELALKILKKRVSTTGTLRAMKRHEFHVARSWRRRLRSTSARKRAAKVERRRAMYEHEAPGTKWRPPQRSGSGDEPKPRR